MKLRLMLALDVMAALALSISDDVAVRFSSDHEDTSLCFIFLGPPGPNPQEKAHMNGFEVGGYAFP